MRIIPAWARQGDNRGAMRHGKVHARQYIIQPDIINYPLPVPPDLQSGGNEYKDLQSGNGITNADTQHDGIANPVEQPAEV